MADWFAENAPAAAAAPPPGGDWFAKNAPPPKEGGGFLSHFGTTLASAPGAIAHTVAHPLDALKAWRDQSEALHDAAVDAAQQGNYQEAAAHGINFLANIIPGLGKVMDDAAKAGAEHGLTSDEFKAKLGDVVATTLLTKAGEKAPALVKGTAKTLAAAPGAVMDFARTPGNIQLATGAGEVVGGAGAMVAGHPFGGGAAVLRGFENIGKGMDKRSSAATEAAPPAATTPVDPILDQIAQSTAGKKFAQLDPAARTTVQKIADAAKAKTAPPEPPPAAAPPSSSAPTPPPPAAPAAPAAVEPQVMQLPATEHPGAEIFKAKARAQRAELAGPIADTLEAGGLTAELAKKMAPKDWLRLSKAEGIGVNIPPKLAAAVIDELDSRAAARDLAKTQAGTQAAADAGAKADATRRDTMIAPSAAYAEALKRPGALAAAKALADELAGDTPETLAQARVRRTKAFEAAKAKR